MIPFSLKIGNRSSITNQKIGDSSKPISVYAIKETEKWYDSSAGFKINIFNFSYSYNLSWTDFSGTISLTEGDMTNSFSYKSDFSKFETGYELSNTVESDGRPSIENYGYVSINGYWVLVVVFAYLTGSIQEISPEQGNMQPQPA